MKNIFSLAIIIMAVTYCQNAWAVYDFCDFSAVAPSGQRLYFMYNYQNGGVKIVSPSPHHNYVTGDLVIPASVSYNGSTYAVTKIEQNAFSSCPGLSSVTIPNSVISIGNSAFYGCSNLTSVDYTGTIAQWCNIDFSSETSNPVYYSHSLNISGSPITNLAIPDGVTEIKPFVFYSSSMTSVTMPSSVITIGNHAFFGCTSLSSMTLPDSNTTIGNYAFFGCTSLSTITFSGNNTSIGSSAFSGCTSLSNITLSGNNTSIGSSAFSGCTSLSNITLSGNNTSIGHSAFSGCTALTSVTIPSSVISIGNSAFYGCTNLTSVDYNGTIAQWCNIDFSSETSNPVYYSHSLNISGSPVTNLTIPDGVTEIKPFVFYYCSSLTSVTIPSSVTTIGNYAFYGCSGLTTVDYTGTIVQWCNIDFSGYYANPVYYSHSLNINGSSLNINDSSVTNLVIPNSVTSIGDDAFANCTALTFVTIPNSVTSIGTNAFYNVRHIEYYGNATGSPWGANSWNGIIDGDFVYADATKHKLLAYIGTDFAVTIPSIVDTIGNYAFCGCSGLTSVTIPSSVKSIGRNAFRGCSGLTSITIPSSVKSIGYNAFYGCSGLTSIYINYGVTSISTSVFSGCTSLSSITIPSSVTSIGSAAFSGCTSLSSITIPYGVTLIGDGAFSGCTSLSSITLPNSITSIEARAFSNCTTLTSVSIPSSVISIGNSAFDGCTALTSVNYACINYAFSIAGWCNIDFSDERSNPVYYSHSLKINGSSVTELVIPNNVTKIKAYAFVKCSSLTTVSIPSSVTSIGYFAFDGCSGLSSVTIPSSVTTINNYAFRDVRHIEYYGNATGSPWGAKSMNGVMEGDFVYSDITKHYLQAYVGDGGAVTIPSTVDTIGNNAFYGCVGLTSINIPGTVTSIGTSAFYYCGRMTTATIGDSVTNIGNSAFAGCSSLSMVYCMAPPPTICDNTFDPTVIFYVPCHYVTNYRSTTYWENHSLRIHGTLQMEYTCSFTPSNDAFGEVSVGIMNCDSNIMVTAVANIGHQFIGWSDGGTDNPRVFHITSDTTMTAFFDYITYSIVAQPSDSIYGTVTVNGNFRYGDTVILTASANYGYHFLRWSDNNTENPRTVVVSQNASYTAYFEPNNYNVNVISDNIVQGTVSGGGAITYLDTFCISAIPATNYHFSHWNDGDSNASRCFTVEEDITLIAYFEINHHQLIVLPNDSALGTVTGSGIYGHGTEVTVSAISAPGSRFIRWNDNSQLASRTVTITKDMQLMAIFMPVDTVIVHDTSYVDVHDTTYVNVPYAVHDTTYIDVHDTTYIDVPYAVHDTTIVVDTLTLTEYVPVHDTTYIDIHDTTFVPVHDTTYVNVHDTTFITLTDTVTNTVYDTITNTVFDTVTNTIYDTTIVYSTDTLWLHDTVFVHDTIFIYDTIYVGVDEVETISAKIYTSNGQIIVDGTQGNTVWIFDVNGRVLATKQDEYSPLHFDVPASGAYMVKIGDHTARKVVVIK